MTNVSSIAESFSSPAPEPAFTWTFSGAPIRIKVPLALIARLRSELEQIPSAKGDGPEAGGVLFGRITLAALEIVDYRWVLSEHLQEDRFNLNAGVLKRMRAGGRPTPAEPLPESQVVGYFRTQAGGTLRLRSEELSNVQEQFSDPASVVLVIDTKAKPYNAGFFFWMESSVFTPFSLRDFPLDPVILGLQEKPPTARVNRAPTPVALAQTTAGEATEPERSTGEEIEIASVARTLEFASWRGRLPVLAIGLGLVILALAGVAILNRSGRSPTPTTPPLAVSPSPLGLEVQEQPGGLSVRWNSESPAVQHASHGSLEVREGNQLPQVIPLDSQQLASGHVYYRSSGERVQFGLAIVDGSGKMTREFVLTLSATPAVIRAQPRPGNITVASSVLSSPVSPATKPVATPSAESIALPAKMSSASPRVFSPPVRGSPGASPFITVDQPPSLTGNPPSPSLGVPATLSRLPAPPVLQPTVQTATAKPLPLGGIVQAGDPITRVAPIYPPTARLARIEGTVRFTATIAKDGSVLNLQTVSGNAALVAAAAEAVKRWVYRPTLLNGTPVEAVRQIEVSFSLNRR